MMPNSKFNLIASDIQTKEQLKKECEDATWEEFEQRGLDPALRHNEYWYDLFLTTLYHMEDSPDTNQSDLKQIAIESAEEARKHQMASMQHWDELINYFELLSKSDN